MRTKTEYLALCCALYVLSPLSGFAQSDPYFIAKPQPSIIGYGGAVITALANGSTTPINYQFQQYQGSSWANVSPNSTLNTYNASSTGIYRVVAQNGSGATNASDSVSVTLTSPNPPIYFRAQPVSTWIAGAGGSFTISAIALPNPPAPSYQWMHGQTTITGATSSAFSILGVSSTDAGTYTVVATDSQHNSVTSSNCVLSLVSPTISTPPQNQVVAAGSPCTFNVAATTTYPPISYAWSLNGVPMYGLTTSLSLAHVKSSDAGPVTVAVGQGNPPGGTAIASATLSVYNTPGGCTGWGDDTYGQRTPPAGLANISRVAAGWYHSVALLDNGTVTCWGANDSGQATPPPGLKNVVAIAASRYHSLALRSDGTVVGWGGGVNGSAGPPPINSNIIAIGAGVNWSLALRSDGTVEAWGDNTFGQTSVPSGLNGVISIACGDYHALAVKKSDGTVVAWGYNSVGQCNVPSGLSGVVQVSAGQIHSLALKSNGTVVGWGNDALGEISGLTSLNNVMQIAAGGSGYSLALKNDGSLFACGNNVVGQTTIPPGMGTSNYPEVYICAGRSFGFALGFSGTVDYPVDVSKDVLLIYNSASPNSATLLNYYIAHRYGMSGANVLAINYAPQVDTIYADFQAYIAAPVTNWLALNPTKRPHYMILFLDVPDRISDGPVPPPPVNQGAWVGQSVAYALGVNCGPLTPIVSHINMGSLADCEAYVNKLQTIGNEFSPGQLDISPSSTGYVNYRYWIDDDSSVGSVSQAVSSALLASGVSQANITISTLGQGHLNDCDKMAAYFSWGMHGTCYSGGCVPANYAINDSTVIFESGETGFGGWYIMFTDESFNGQIHYDQSPQQGNYIDWFSSGAFGGTSYFNTPVGAVSSVNEPYWQTPDTFLGLWASGKRLGSCSFSFLFGGSTIYESIKGPRIETQPVGDPFVRR